MMIMRKYWKYGLILAVVAGVVARVKLASVPVVPHRVQAADIAAEVLGTGTLEARIKTTVSPRIQERLAAVLVDQNDAVTNGQLLAVLDDAELKLQVEVASASLATAKATADRVQVDEARAQAVLEQARQEYARISDLVSTKVSAQAELDKAIEQMQVAESDLRRAHAATTEARHQVITAEKNHAYQQERLDFTRIRSPYDGLITRRDRDPGGVVVPGSSILQLISTNEIWVSAWVDETAAAGLAVGQQASVLFRSHTNRQYAGGVARLGRETDRETREFVVDVRVRELPPNWTIGQRAEVFIVTGRKAGALAVPTRYTLWREGKPGVFVERGGKAAWTEVRFGLRGRDVVEVTEGMDTVERIDAVGASQPVVVDSVTVATS